MVESIGVLEKKNIYSNDQKWCPGEYKFSSNAPSGEIKILKYDVYGNGHFSKLGLSNE